MAAREPVCVRLYRSEKRKGNP